MPPVTTTPASHNKPPVVATVLGASFAGAAEMGIFYSPEAIARRLQTNKTKLYTPGGGVGGFFNNLNQAIWPNLEAGQSKLRNLYSGFGVGLMYKMAQRGYKFAGSLLLKKH